MVMDGRSLTEGGDGDEARGRHEIEHNETISFLAAAKENFVDRLARLNQEGQQAFLLLDHSTLTAYYAPEIDLLSSQLPDNWADLDGNEQERWAEKQVGRYQQAYLRRLSDEEKQGIWGSVNHAIGLTSHEQLGAIFRALARLQTRDGQVAGVEVYRRSFNSTTPNQPARYQAAVSSLPLFDAVVGVERERPELIEFGNDSLVKRYRTKIPGVTVLDSDKSISGPRHRQHFINLEYREGHF